MCFFPLLNSMDLLVSRIFQMEIFKEKAKILILFCGLHWEPPLEAFWAHLFA